MSDEKKMLGQFFTITNPFQLDIFYKWFKLIPEDKKQTILEPFAGSNNIVKMIQSININSKWNCYDIAPVSEEDNATPEFPVMKQDTLADFPKNYDVAITNPPYLAKNSATRSGIKFPECDYDDLYKFAVCKMLENVQYVAAIIPESFISADLFHERLYAFISLTCKMFEDTDCPVCLALFIPEAQKKQVKLKFNDFFVYQQNKKIGNYLNLIKKKPTTNISADWKFNDPNGNIGIKCADDSKTPSIEFVLGNTITAEIKVSSRSITRVSGLPDGINLSTFLQNCNTKLNHFREDTEDVFLTSFKGLRKDGKYRRRLDFANARMIMNSVLEDMGYKEVKDD